MTTVRKSVLEIIQSSTGYLQKNGVESPRLNAELLTAHVLKIKRLDLYLEFDRTLYEDELAPLRDLLRKRSSGTPLQHLLGSVEFFGRVFKTDPRALIPRPETEHLVELILPLLRENARTIADIGTGSGIIALTLAAELPETHVTAVDISSDALALTRENAESLGLADRVTLLPGHLLDPLDGTFDWLIANLPYIPTADLAGLSREVRCDPVTALDGGRDGLDLIRLLITSAPGKLNPGGGIALEIGHDQAAQVADLLNAANFRDIRIERDYQDVSRFLIARYG